MSRKKKSKSSHHRRSHHHKKPKEDARTRVSDELSVSDRFELWLNDHKDTMKPNPQLQLVQDALVAKALQF